MSGIHCEKCGRSWLDHGTVCATSEYGYTTSDATNLMDGPTNEQMRESIAKMKALREEGDEKFAAALMNGGIQLIAHDYLPDNTIMVSKRVFDAAKRVAAKQKESK